MDHGSVGLVPRIYGVRDYVEADPAAKKTSPYQGSLFSCWGNRVRLVVGRTLSSVSR